MKKKATTKKKPATKTKLSNNKKPVKNVQAAAKTKKRALITGITGQDGSYLAEYLIDQGYDVWGFIRRSSLEPYMRIGELVRSGKLKLIYGNLRDVGTIARAMEEAKPDEVYNLAAQSDVWVSFKSPEETFDVNYHGLGRVINEAVRVNPKVRIYQASTSEMFGKTKPPQSESSPFAPVSPYGEAKLRAHTDYVVGYRDRHGLYICSGILFNHESPRRGENFVTRKVTSSLARIKLGLQDSFSLGNLEAIRDWGFAGDYVKMMHLMLQQDKPEDFVVATGKSHTVRELVEAAAKALDIPITWKGSGMQEVGVTTGGKVILTVDPNYYRPVEVDYLLGDYTKAKKKLGWKPETTFEELVAMIAKADYERLRKTI